MWRRNPYKLPNSIEESRHSPHTPQQERVMQTDVSPVNINNTSSDPIILLNEKRASKFMCLFAIKCSDKGSGLVFQHGKRILIVEMEEFLPQLVENVTVRLFLSRAAELQSCIKSTTIYSTRREKRQKLKMIWFVNC